MGLMSLPSKSRVFLDSLFAIYLVEQHPTYGPICQRLWQEMVDAAFFPCFSELAILECLVIPLRSRSDQAVAAFDEFFQQPGVNLLPISRAVLRAAAEIRGSRPRVRTPDAIHLATAEQWACASIVTNDAAFEHCTTIPVLRLDRLLAPPSA